MKKKVMKKWATRIMLATDFYAAKWNDDDKLVNVKMISRHKDVPLKFIFRVLSYPSFNNFMQKEYDMRLMPSYREDKDGNTIYDSYRNYSYHKGHFDAFMNSNGCIELFVQPSVSK